MIFGMKGVIVSAVVIAVAVAVALVTFFLVKKFQGEGDCEVGPFEVDPAPLYILSNTTQWIYPTANSKTLKFSFKQNVDFICPNANLIIQDKVYNVTVITGYCQKDKLFMVDGRKVRWNEIECSRNPWRSIRATGAYCEHGGQTLEIGFDVADDGRFIKALDVCFNTTLQVANYVFQNMTMSVNQRVLGTPRPPWMVGSGIYAIGSVSSHYLRTNQRKSVNGLLGLEASSGKYIVDSTNTSLLFLARGHLSARSDHFYPSQQNATFFMQNIAPQWQTFNSLNWNQIEADVRDYAEDNSVDLQVWNGVYGIATLPHETTAVPSELYLYTDDNDNRALPVPAIYWKVAYNPLTERGVALIGVNNPYEEKLQPICNDISDRITWLHWKKNNQLNGYSYACAVDIFRRIVTAMPEVPVRETIMPYHQQYTLKSEDQIEKYSNNAGHSQAVLTSGSILTVLYCTLTDDLS